MDRDTVHQVLQEVFGSQLTYVGEFNFGLLGPQDRMTKHNRVLPNIHVLTYNRGGNPPNSWRVYDNRLNPRNEGYCYTDITSIIQLVGILKLVVDR